MKRQFQPRWRACAAAFGIDPAELPTLKYIRWIDKRWDEWAELTGRSRSGLNEDDHMDFNAWLQERAAR